jgi:hypothetical protein
VDLAGSELLNDLGNKKETICINTSLFALKQVWTSLIKKKKTIYRTSELTKLLSQSFGGKSKTTIVICCSASSDQSKYSEETLKFAQSLEIINSIAVNEIIELNQCKSDATKTISIGIQTSMIEKPQNKKNYIKIQIKYIKT